MSHVPNISFREAVGLGAVATLGRYDFASPDNHLLGPRTRGVAGRCSVGGASGPGWLAQHPSAASAWQAFLDSLARGQAGLAAQAYRLPTPAGSPAKITQQDFISAAEALKCEVAAVKAVAEVEARGSGFLGDGRPKILFEAHKFSRYTGHLHDSLFPHISSPEWKKGLYLGGVKEYDRLHDAMKLDPRAAIMSASWGAFQIMGFNHAATGFATPEEFVAAMYKGEGEHLRAFIAFVRSRKLGGHIQEKNWAAFAKAYNGDAYRENNYDAKLAKAYAKHAAPPTARKPLT